MLFRGSCPVSVRDSERGSGPWKNVVDSEIARTATQLYEFRCDGDGVFGDKCVRAETAASCYSEVQSRLDQTVVVAILCHTYTRTSTYNRYRFIYSVNSIFCRRRSDNSGCFTAVFTIGSISSTVVGSIVELVFCRATTIRARHMYERRVRL